MSSGVIKFLLVLMGVSSVAASTYFLEQVIRSDRSFQVTSSPDEEVTDASEDGEGGEQAATSPDAKPEEHGADEHGEGGQAKRKPASVKTTPAPIIVAMEQTFANVLDADSHAHSLMLKLDIELFEDANRSLVDQRDGVLKSTIIETVREQTYEQLITLGGKVYFKEVLVSKINEALRKAVVRDIHFNTFYMQ